MATQYSTVSCGTRPYLDGIMKLFKLHPTVSIWSLNLLPNSKHNKSGSLAADFPSITNHLFTQPNVINISH